MVDITVLELHFDEAPNFVASKGKSESSRRGSSGRGSRDETDADESGGPPVKAALLGFVLIIAVAVAAKRFMGGSDESEEKSSAPEMVDLDESTPIISGDDTDETAD